MVELNIGGEVLVKVLLKYFLGLVFYREHSSSMFLFVVVESCLRYFHRKKRETREE